MSNHLHLIWKVLEGHKKENMQRDFLKFTGQRLKEDLLRNYPKLLLHFAVAAKDGKYQFWERNSLRVDLFSEAVFLQYLSRSSGKLEYVHSNPVRVWLCEYPEGYKYSSASFYETGRDDFGFLCHYKGRRIGCW